MRRTLLTIGNNNPKVYRRMCSLFECLFDIDAHHSIDFVDCSDVTALHPDGEYASILNDHFIIIVFYGCTYAEAEGIKEYINDYYGYRDMYFWHDVYGALSM